MALHLTVLSFLMAFHKDGVLGHCCLPFIPANSFKSLNTIYLQHMPMLMTLSFTCRLVLTRLLIRMVVAMERRISDIRTWMLTDKIKLNNDKTEFMLIGTKQQLSKVNIDSH